jgi:RNase adapter protein RapZ
MTTLTTAGRASTSSAPASHDRRRVLLISGLAGAGRTTALRALEDLGYEAIDNLPLELLPHLVSGIASEESDGPIAIGIDSRSRGFTGAEFLNRIETLRADPRFEIVLVFLDCSDDVLIRRFTETRRRHPLAPDRNAADGIAQERTLMFPVRAVADLMVDTSNRSMAELKRLMTERFALQRRPGLAITVMSFSYRIGVPREADLVFDVRFLSNPHYIEALEPLNGEAPEVGRFIERDPALTGFLASLDALIEPLLPSYEREGKSYLTIAVGCTGGKHRSVYVARKLAEALQASGRPIALIHRDLAHDVSGRSEQS